jgi:DNA-binding MarR family transcriptional regulator/N-acetylglutamate synthase-like GNAT family acetyltransferase
MDFFAELKEQALASRLKRLSERMLEEGEALYQELGFNFRPRWFPLFYTLSRQSPLAVTELAAELGISHPAVNKIAHEMSKAGLITETKDSRDDRKRMLSLSPKGRETLVQLQPVWDHIRQGAQEMLKEAKVNLVEDLEKVEKAFARQSVVARVRERMGVPQPTTLSIVDYRPAYKKYFKSLNEAWLKDFGLEKHDVAMLNDPNRNILMRGGAILFALISNQVVGTCALVRYKNDVFELCKMAVTPAARRNGIGRALTQAILARARERGAKQVFLQTSPKLAAAVKLYQQAGFLTSKSFTLPRPDYNRCSITMIIDLTDRAPQENFYEL